MREAESLASQVTALKAEKEETATKVSELEIEILELKEAQEALEDERDQLKNVIKSLEGNLAQAQSNIAKASQDFKTAEEQHTVIVEELRLKHVEELGAAAEKHSQVVELLQSVQGSLESANLELEKARSAADQAEEAHKLKLLEVEQAYMMVQNELTEKIATITAELEVSVFCRTRSDADEISIGSRGAI